MGLPVSFKQFSKDPMKSMLYIALAAIMYLYIDNKMDTSDRIDYLMEQNDIKDGKIEKLNSELLVLSKSIGEIKGQIKENK